jgi:folate-dependent phosphoribosylglycinamide formyltransferase PurN
MRGIRVIILAGQDESTRLMFNGIKDSFSIEKVIIEEPVSKREFLTLRLNRLGLLKVIGQILFMAYNRILLKIKSQTRINEIKHNKNLNDKNIDEAIVLKVNSVNCDETKRILEEYQPDVVVVNGTRILKKEIIESIDTPFVNTHAGITPKYRGVHGGYWALTEHDMEHCGVSVHLIDTGIDTGGILYQDVIEITDKDTFNTYPYLQMAAAIPLMEKAINDIANKTYKTRKVDLTSKLWSHPTIMEYLKYRILHSVK